MNSIELIDKKRQGLAHTPEELDFWIQGVVSKTIPDYQQAAWLMAVCCNGLTLDETTWLTERYVRSGQVLDFSGIEGTVVDKHSTGGVGDKTTLILGPMLAACGLKVAKLSGRGLGYTGGTIDKLEAIPGFQVDLSIEQFMAQTQNLGMALGAQTQDFVPADGILYALRDVTATVASIPLIAASVVSKKVATGAQVIVLDIKVGEGAFMKSFEEAQQLAYTCREVGKRLGRSISTLISNMDQPLGRAIGHTVEVIEAIETLKGQGPEDLTQLCLTLGALVLVDAYEADSLEEGREIMKSTLSSGAALQKFRQVIEAQHGDSRVIDQTELMPQPRHKITVHSQQSGTIQACHALKIAQAAKVLGAGRLTKSDSIDLAVGLSVFKKVGDPVIKDEPLVELWANEQGIEEAQWFIQQAYEVTDNPVSPPRFIQALETSRHVGNSMSLAE